MKRSWIEVDLNVLQENAQAIRAAISPGTELICVVKANAYGHGAIPVAQRAAQAGARWFAVAYVEEAIKLRAALPGVKLLVIGVVDPADAGLLFEHQIIPVIATEEHGMALALAARKFGRDLDVHIKIDTGMGRIGLPWEQAPEIIRRLSNESGLNITGICSHFAKVEPKEPESAGAQAERFFSIATGAEQLLGRKLFKHLSSSRAILYHQEWDLDGIRPGIILYGYGTGKRNMRFRTRPILQWKALVMQVRSVPAGFPVGYYGTWKAEQPTDIATLAVGYADGYLRILSNKGYVLIHGRRCPVVGAVSMNWIAVDVGPASGVKRGDEAVLIGEQGNESVWADELAAKCKTIAYEILTGIDSSIRRHYIY
ncbi:MAG: alanine racemase [Kiritimatiellia bacterium]